MKLCVGHRDGNCWGFQQQDGRLQPCRPSEMPCDLPASVATTHIQSQTSTMPRSVVGGMTALALSCDAECCILIVTNPEVSGFLVDVMQQLSSCCWIWPRSCTVYVKYMVYDIQPSVPDTLTGRCIHGCRGVGLWRICRAHCVPVMCRTSGTT